MTGRPSIDRSLHRTGADNKFRDFYLFTLDSCAAAESFYSTTNTLLASEEINNILACFATRRVSNILRIANGGAVLTTRLLESIETMWFLETCSGVQPSIGSGLRSPHFMLRIWWFIWLSGVVFSFIFLLLSLHCNSTAATKHALTPYIISAGIKTWLIVDSGHKTSHTNSNSNVL